MLPDPGKEKLRNSEIKSIKIKISLICKMGDKQTEEEINLAKKKKRKVNVCFCFFY